MSTWHRVGVTKTDFYLVEVESEDPENAVINHIGPDRFDTTCSEQVDARRLAEYKQQTDKDKILPL